MAPGALADLTVLELTENVAGPFCAKLLADMGAQVIKIERPGRGDPARMAGPFPGGQPHPEKSGLFLYLNTNKKGITLGLESEAGRHVFRRLARDADILVESLGPGALTSLGLGYEALAQVNPRLIMTSISYFGQTGPRRDYKGADIVASALGGMMGLTGTADRPPLKVGGYQADYLGGLNAYVATMTALGWRDRGGPGQRVDVSIVESVASILECATVLYSYAGVIWRRGYPGHFFAAPETVPCQDGYVLPTHGRDWPLFCSWLGRPELATSELANPIARIERYEEYEALLEEAFRERRKRDIFRSAQEWRLPFSYVRDMEDVVSDPHDQARGFPVEVDHPAAGRLTYPGAPFKMGSTPWQAGRAPLLGEHNEEVYCQRLGLGGEELARLKEASAI